VPVAEVSVQLLAQKSSGVDGYSSGAYVLRSQLTNAVAEEGLMLLAACAGLVTVFLAASFITYPWARTSRRSRSAPTCMGRSPKGPDRLGQGTLARQTSVVLSLGLGAVVGWRLACLLPRAFQLHDSSAGKVHWASHAAQGGMAQARPADSLHLVLALVAGHGAVAGALLALVPGLPWAWRGGVILPSTALAMAVTLVATQVRSVFNSNKQYI